MSVVEIDIKAPGGSWVDYTDSCVFSRCTFQTQMGGVSGRFDVYLRDDTGAYSFTTGSEIRLTVDGVEMFGGYVLMKGMTSFAEAADTSDLANYRLRLWHLSGPDYNVVLDKRFFRNTSDWTHSIRVNSAVDGVVLRTALGSYADLSDFDTTTMVADIATQPDTTYIVIQQGWELRKEFETLLNFSGAVYYVNPSKQFVWQPYESVEKRWGFSDAPNKNPITSSPATYQGATYGFASVKVTEDGTYFANDIFMWGGTAFSPTGGTVLARRQDATTSHTSTSSYYVDDGTVVAGSSIDVHGRWQYAEQHFGDSHYATVNQAKMAAENMLLGSVGGTEGQAKGLRYPQWQATFRWLSSHVPLLSGVPDHIRAGDLVNIELQTFSESRLLPLRSMTITFPDASEDATEAGRIVAFEGTFGLQLSDSYLLWRYIQKQRIAAQQAAAVAPVTPSVTPSSGTTVYGASFVGTPTPTPNGSATLFTLPFGYIASTLAVYVNGLVQRPGTDFTETDPAAGTFTTTSTLVSTDTITCTCFTLAS